ncbi:MAG: hypothetical protein HMLKMBBP_01879 [Planctomycetes bacterium]|nr:hypothetical protein [Planctomycetota bacterium]
MGWGNAASRREFVLPGRAWAANVAASRRYCTPADAVSASKPGATS